MTKTQKDKIIEMRKEEITYSAISEELNIPVSTIKTFCRRNNMTRNTKKGVCKNCGKVITQKIITKPRMFCCEKCKKDWWNKHRTERKSSKLCKIECAFCGKVFIDYKTTNRKYCSQDCYRKRKKLNEE